MIQSMQNALAELDFCILTTSQPQPGDLEAK